MKDKDYKTLNDAFQASEDYVIKLEIKEKNKTHFFTAKGSMPLCKSVFNQVVNIFQEHIKNQPVETF